MFKPALCILAGATLTLSAARANFTITVHAASPGNTVAPTMFGTNLVYNRTAPANLTTFVDTMKALGMTTLRYPGGTVTETDFDFRQSNVSGTKTNCITLSLFLQAVQANGFTPLLVVKTKNFDAGQDPVQYARDFVRAVNIDHGVPGGEQFGTTQRVDLWEIGNEYYASPNGLQTFTPQAYGQLANQYGPAMMAIDPGVQPAVQFERTDLAGASTIRQQLGDGNYKGCLTHVYTGLSVSFADVENQLTTGGTTFGFTPMVTEWNMGSDAGTGMVQANYLPQIFAALVNAGVKVATQWPLMGDADAGTSNLAQSDGTLRPAGQVYQWLSEVAKGRKIVAVDPVNSDLTAVAFKSGGNLSVLVLCGAAATDTPVDIEIMGFNGTGFHVDKARRYSAAGGNVDSILPAVMTIPSPAKNGNVLTLKANHNSKYEVIRLDLINTP